MLNITRRMLKYVLSSYVTILFTIRDKFGPLNKTFPSHNLVDGERIFLNVGTHCKVTAYRNAVS